MLASVQKKEKCIHPLLRDPVLVITKVLKRIMWRVRITMRGVHMNKTSKKMRAWTIQVVFVLMFFASYSTILVGNEGYGMEKPKHIILLGASVAKDWKMDDLPKRVNLQGFRFEYVWEYQFDKTKPLQEILQRKENKPDAIFIKECAAYFPGDLQNYQALMKTWVKQCREAKVIPIPTTVVPVIRPDSIKMRAKEFVKRLLGRPTSKTQIAEIIKYNDWVKSYAQEQGLVVLDLETPLHISDADRSLRLDLHSGDGLHLNEKAYALLDRIVVPVLDKAFGKPKKY